MKSLFKAIRQNDLDKVIKILDKKPEAVNCMATAPPKKDDGQSPLQVSIKTGNLEIAQYLIKKGADVNYMEPDDGLPVTRSYRCPVLFDAIRGMFSRWENCREKYLQLISQILELGADPNKQDNRGCNSWDIVLSTYSEKIEDVKDNTNKDLFVMMTKKLLDILIQFNIDILNIERIKKDLKQFETHSLLLENLILNRDDLYGVKPDMVESWNKNIMPIIELVKPYYENNSPYYEDETTKK